MIKSKYYCNICTAQMDADGDGLFFTVDELNCRLMSKGAAKNATVHICLDCETKIHNAHEERNKSLTGAYNLSYLSSLVRRPAF